MIWMPLLVSFDVFFYYFSVHQFRINFFVNTSDSLRCSLVRIRFVSGSDKACLAVKSFEALTTWFTNSLALCGVVYSMSSQRMGKPFGYAEPHEEVLAIFG
ncbi:unnamed protein product [Cuscuta epithymum]|uniref:Uncharacterized protein n=1 Tax=Cuscuta epithymum TaxID=186058 RepID=A0AAV0GJV4_9ASTE|nr:unnamed protein product [Cuscuta epithymum]